ncbi:MAG: T9SS type A sorting domain-containing protein [Candidatus Cloacimonetes bacterium]|jgi:hypothetical protein|nr:T9SS type A sorting domain-containing protein [Candidatus Cloacimonadota bacterium]
MKRYILIVFLAAFALLSAQTAPYYPTTLMVENFGASWCGACAFALAGLDVIEGEVMPGEVIFTRLLTESGEYSKPEVEDRFDYYDIIGLPVVMFNGKTRIAGSDDVVADGTLYREALNLYRYTGSPVKLELNSFDYQAGNYSFTATNLNDIFSTDEAKIVLYIVENNLGEMTRIVRTAQSQDITLNGAGDTATASFSVTNDAAWNLDNIWAAAFVQTSSGSILQAISTLPVPENQVRVAVPFDLHIKEEEPGAHFSPVFYLYNLGPATTFNTHIEIIEAPEDWFINYCDEEGNCFPGSFAFAHPMTENGFKALDLNLYVGSLGYARFNFIIETDFAEPYAIPFEMTVGPTSTSDELAPEAGLSAKAYPNPFAGEIRIKIDSDKERSDEKLLIYNLKGQMVKSLNLGQIKAGESVITADLQSLADGIYFYRLENDKTTRKLIKIK